MRKAAALFAALALLLGVAGCGAAEPEATPELAAGGRRGTEL